METLSLGILTSLLFAWLIERSGIAYNSLPTMGNHSRASIKNTKLD